jgi:hypothetical protein
MPFLLEMSDRRLAAAFFRASPPKLPPLAAAKSLACLALGVLTVGCASRQATAPPKPMDKPSTAIAFLPTAPRPTPAPSAPPPPPRQTSPAPESLTPPRPRSGHSAEVAGKLDSAFVVESIGQDFLLVSKKTSAPARTPSLFEQSILLGKIRGTLTSASPRSAQLAQSASLKNGLATISIPSSTPAGTAAVAIAKILALDGVTSVRANFPPSAQ